MAALEPAMPFWGRRAVCGGGGRCCLRPLVTGVCGGPQTEGSGARAVAEGHATSPR